MTCSHVTHPSFVISTSQTIPLITIDLLPVVAQVYHPNIDLEGKICLNILREDWKPVLSISSVVYGLQFLFLVGGHSLLSGHGVCRVRVAIPLSTGSMGLSTEWGTTGSRVKDCYFMKTGFS